MSIDFLLKAYTLKSLARAGWLRVGIKHPESVASHSWGLSLLVLLYCPPHINKRRALELSIVHDLPEVIVGDITPHDNISKEEKHRREKVAAQNLLPPELYKIWCEYQENTSPEAQFIHRLDKLEMGIQALAYNDIAPTEEFLRSALDALPLDLQQLLLQFQKEVSHEP